MGRKKLCDICNRKEKDNEMFARTYKLTTKEYAPDKEMLTQKIIYRTNQVWVCPQCYLTKIKHKKLAGVESNKTKKLIAKCWKSLTNEDLDKMNKGQRKVNHNHFVEDDVAVKKKSKVKK